MASSGGLSEEQKRRIEENKRKALQKRAERSAQAAASSGVKVGSTSSSLSSSSSSSSSLSSSSSTNSNSGGAKLWRPTCVSSNQPKPNNQFTSIPANQNISFPRQQTSTSTSSASKSFNSRTDSAQIDSQSVAEHHHKSAEPGFSGQKTITQFYASSNSKTSGAGSSSKSTQPTPTVFGSKLGQSSWSKGRGSAVQQNQRPLVNSKPGGLPLNPASLTGYCVLVSRNRFKVEIGYHTKLIEIFKAINSKSYDVVEKKWSFALSDHDELMEAVRVLKSQVEITPLPKSVCLAFLNQRRGIDTSQEVPEANLESVDRTLVDALMPFQRIGVDFAIHHNGRALIADEMGLGKTIQAICVSCYYRTEWPVLVVSPSSVRFSWAEAFTKWVPSLDEDSINVVTSGKEDVGCGLVNIISYDLVSRKLKELLANHFRVVIMDESHFLKNFKTVRTKSALPLLKAATRIIMLSGTPALSRPAELFNQISAIDPRMFPSFHEFAVRYCDAKQNTWGWDYSGSSNLAELQLLLEEKVMIRRMKKDVLKQLPSKTRQMVIMDPGIVKTNSKLLKSAAKEMEKTEKKAEQRETLLHYYSQTATAKVPAVRDYVIDLAEGGHKFLVFAHHQVVLDALSQALTKNKFKYIRIDGSTSSQRRKELVDKFQTNDSYQVAVLSITACNAGITLTAASMILFAELFWNPGILVQAEDRVHRIGQQDSVTVRYLLAKGTADDYIWPLVQKKLATLSKAGLSKDDFHEADMTTFKDPKQRSILSYFETSFLEEDEELSQEMIDCLEAAEASDQNTAPADTDQQEHQQQQQQQQEQYQQQHYLAHGDPQLYNDASSHACSEDTVKENKYTGAIAGSKGGFFKSVNVTPEGKSRAPRGVFSSFGGNLCQGVSSSSCNFPPNKKPRNS